MRLAFILLAASTLSAADLQIINGDMRAGEAVPTGWGEVWAGSGTVTTARDTTVFASAPASLRVTLAGDEKSNGNAHQELTAAAGKRIHVSGKLRVGAGKQIAGIAVQAFDAQGKQILWQDIARGQTTGASFQAFDGLASVPAEATRVLLTIHMTGVGDVWLDDAAVLPAL